MESLLRRKLAHQPMLKLVFKGCIELTKFDFYHAGNSFIAAITMFKLGLGKLIKNNKNVRCNYCNWTGNSFYPHNTRTQNVPNEICPKCLSIPRYRSLLEFLNTKTNFLTSSGKILEIGPNRSLQEYLQKKDCFEYISVDIQSPQAMMKMDIMDLKFPDHTFDFVFAISVLVFVENDIKGMSEMYRVLKRGGFALIAANIREDMEVTIEYGKADPKKSFARRLYGKDIVKKLESVGFKVERHDMMHELSEKEIKEYAIKSSVIYKLVKS
jgi:hypothetical protein